MPINLSYESDLAPKLSSSKEEEDDDSNNNYRSTPLLYINGRRIPPHLAKLARPNQTLLSFLRDTLHLTGSKLGCGEGGCGACTVLLSRQCKSSGTKLSHRVVNACLFPVLAVDGCHVTTVEGVGSWQYENTTTSTTNATSSNNGEGSSNE